MIKTLSILAVLLTLTSFKRIESCERLKPNIITIFPICGDTATYIRRHFEYKKFIYEEVYEKGMRMFVTKLWFSGTDIPDSVRFTEFAYHHGKLIDTRSSSRLGYALEDKTFKINDTLTFVITYSRNGSLESYGFKHSFCRLSGADLDIENKFIWKGRFQPEICDTLQRSSTMNPNQPMSVNCKCGQRTGIWRKLDGYGNVIDSIDMTGSRDLPAAVLQRQLLDKRSLKH